jgi:cytidylate kinase
VSSTFTIAIDGPAASGKSTVAAMVADQLDAVVFDTGILYRSVALASLLDSIAPDDAEALADVAANLDVEIRPASVADGRLLDVYLRGQDVTWEIRSPDVDRVLSTISALPAVRAALLAPQRRIGRSGRVVMVGRDIGTVVIPEAEVKVYLEASPQERARRRYEEVRGSANEQPLEDVLAALMRRDQSDLERATSPLRPAEDALIINTDLLTAEEVAERIIERFLSGATPEKGKIESRESG